MVKNFQLEYDLIISDTRGSLAILEQKDYGIENNNRYHVWIKAEVTYDLYPKNVGPSRTEIIDQSSLLRVKVWTDKSEYEAGENITIFVRGNRDYYARVIDITPSGQIVQLLPNDYRRIQLFEAGKVYRIPDRGDRFDLLVTPPYGREHIVVYASEAPLGEVSMESIGKGLRLYQGSQNDLASLSRSIKVVNSRTGLGNSTEFYESSWTFFTHP